ncbi:MAG: GTPase/DUF3482 domain-containing protein [Myxococcales bacterium]|nr:GTPase/DUF3482 domain-containing protein [Myxococcales bacterium]
MTETPAAQRDPSERQARAADTPDLADRGGVAPVFAVVGRVNTGKSSVIASLVEDDGVKISPRPGTTTECVRYDVALDDRLLFTVIDTPGFEEAARALHWLRGHADSAAERPRAVGALLERFDGTDEFIEERRLLRPILDGAAVLYVVNGDEPYRPNFEAEMEILRWTGQPAMALINRGADGSHLAEWRRALDQFFQLVRPFDAHRITHADRLELLRAFQVLRPTWRAHLDDAIASLDAERERRLDEVAAIIARLLAQVLTLHLTVVLPEGASLASEKRKLERRFHDRLREAERDAHRDIARAFLHERGQWDPATDAERAEGEDLFAEETWSLMGLPPGTLLALTTLTGAAAGGAIDVAVGAASFMTGAVIGAVGGAGIGLYELGRRFASATRVRDDVRSMWNASRGGQRVRVGPHPSVNFPFVVLARALQHFDRVRDWAHAKAELPPPASPPGDVREQLDVRTAKSLARQFRDLRKRYRDPPRDVRRELERDVRSLLQAHIDPERLRQADETIKPR